MIVPLDFLVGSCGLCSFIFFGPADSDSLDEFEAEAPPSPSTDPERPTSSSRCFDGRGAEDMGPDEFWELAIITVKGNICCY